MGDEKGAIWVNRQREWVENNPVKWRLLNAGLLVLEAAFVMAASVAGFVLLLSLLGVPWK